MASASAAGSASARSARPARDRAPRPVTPTHSASSRAAATTVSMVRGSRAGAAPAQRLDDRGRRGSRPVLEPLELGQHVTPQAAGRWPLHVGSQGVDGAGPPGRRAADEVGGAGRDEPGLREHRPAAGAGQLLPVVIGGGRRPDRLERAVVAHQAGGQGQLGDERCPPLRQVEHGGQPPEVAHGETTGPQHPRRPRTPLGRELVDQHQQVADLLARGRGHHVGVVLRAGQGRRLQQQLAVQPSAPHPQADLSGQAHLVGRDRQDEALAQQPPRSLGDPSRGALRGKHGQRRPPGQAVEDRARRVGRRGEQRVDRPRVGQGGRGRPADVGGGRTEPGDVRAEGLRGHPGHVEAVTAAPQQRGRPQPVQDRRDVGIGAEVLAEQALVDGARLQAGCLEHLQVGAVERVQRPLDAGPGAGPGRQRRQVGGGWAGEVGTLLQELAQLLVGARPHVVGQRASGGQRLRRLGGRGRHAPHGSPRQVTARPETSWRTHSRLPSASQPSGPCWGRREESPCRTRPSRCPRLSRPDPRRRRSPSPSTPPPGGPGRVPVGPVRRVGPVGRRRRVRPVAGRARQSSPDGVPDSGDRPRRPPAAGSPRRWPSR